MANSIHRNKLKNIMENPSEKKKEYGEMLEEEEEITSNYKFLLLFS